MASRLGTALFGLLTVLGCRPALDFCAEGCGAGGGADGGGAGGTDGGDAFGGGGSSSVDCETDYDCADASICNGDERCDGGKCSPGLSLECEAGTACAETEQGQTCEYEHPSPWLLLLTSENVWGLPTAEVGKRPLLALGKRASSSLFVGMNAILFSPDARHALVEFIAEDFGETLLSLSFDRGIPEPARGFPDLPNWGIYSRPIFSPDGLRGLVSELYTGTYLLDFSGSSAKSTMLQVPNFYDDYWLAFCADNDSWLRVGSQTAIYTLGDGQPVMNDLGHEDDDDVELSLDARKIWIGGDSPRLVACSPEGKSQPLGIVADRAEFSPDSRWLLLSLADGSTRLLSVAESLVTNEVWSGTGVAAWAWSPDASSLLLRFETEAASSHGYFALDEAKPVLRRLALAGDASIMGCGSQGCLAQASDQAIPAQALLFQPFDSDAEPSLVGGDVGEPASVVLADFARDRLVLQRSSARGQQLTLTDFAGAAERHLFDWDSGSVEVTLAPDDSGILIRVRDNIELSNFWVPLSANSEDALTVVPLVLPSYSSEFQPWP